MRKNEVYYMGHKHESIETSAVNKLCFKCIRRCRQEESVLLVDCPRFLPRPFKSEEFRFVQLDLFDVDDPSAEGSSESESG